MKGMTASVIGVIALALALGLLFQWLYPRMELTEELAGLFVFAAVVLKLIMAKLRAWRHRARPPAGGEVEK